MKIRNRYSIKFKLKCLELVKIFGIYKTSKIIGIDKKSVRYWYLNMEKLEKIADKQHFYRLPGGGSKIKFPEQEKKVFLFIHKCNEIGINLNSNLIIEEYCRICPKMITCSKKTLRKWYHRFSKRYNFITNHCEKNQNI